MKDGWGPKDQEHKTNKKDKVLIFEMEKSGGKGEKGINIDHLVNFIFQKITRTKKNKMFVTT